MVHNQNKTNHNKMLYTFPWYGNVFHMILCSWSWGGVTEPISSWWRHQLKTFSTLLALCAWNSLATGEFPSQRPVARSFDIFFDLCLNKQLNKQLRHRWFETPLCSLWCHHNPSLAYFPIFQHCPNTAYLLDITAELQQRMTNMNLVLRIKQIRN